MEAVKKVEKIGQYFGGVMIHFQVMEDRLSLLKKLSEIVVAQVPTEGVYSFHMLINN